MKICPKFQVPFPHLYDMINFLFPNSRALLPTFRTNCPDGSHFFQIGTHFAQNTTTNPCSLLSSHTLLLGICTYTKKAPPQNTPFSGLILKVGKWTIVWAKWTATGQNVSKVGKTFLEVGKNFLFILWCWWPSAKSVQSMFNDIIYINPRCAVKKSGVSCLTSIFDLNNPKMKIQ